MYVAARVEPTLGCRLTKSSANSQGSMQTPSNSLQPVVQRDTPCFSQLEHLITTTADKKPPSAQFLRSHSTDRPLEALSAAKNIQTGEEALSSWLVGVSAVQVHLAIFACVGPLLLILPPALMPCYDSWVCMTVQPSVQLWSAFHRLFAVFTFSTKPYLWSACLLTGPETKCMASLCAQDPRVLQKTGLRADGVGKQASLRK